jgi:hypothetical protein
MSSAVEYRAYPEDRDELLRRLAAAEQVCVLYGWTGIRDDSDRTKATTQAWMQWQSQYGVGRPTPAWNARVAELAAERDRIRAHTLNRLRSGGDTDE